MKAADGTPTNAIRGLLDFIARLVDNHQPTHLVACWDDNWRPSWRVALIPSYKAQRVEFVAAGGRAGRGRAGPAGGAGAVHPRLPGRARDRRSSARPDHEADDVIGTLSHQSKMPVDVVTGDRDLFQLIDD